MAPEAERIDEADPRERLYAQFVALLARHDQSIRRYIRSVMPTSDGLEDVVQETALECWRKFSDFGPETEGDEFVRWACVIARYKALSWQRDRARDRLVFRESVVECLSKAANEQFESREKERAAVSRCLGKLSDSHRELVMSIHSPGESVARIAAETGQKARQLYSKVNSLRKILMRCIEKELVEGSLNG